MADERHKSERAEPAKSQKSQAALKGEIAELEKKIADLQAELLKLQQQANFVEFPKHVVHDGVTREFASRAEQDAAGHDWADGQPPSKPQPAEKEKP